MLKRALLTLLALAAPAAVLAVAIPIKLNFQGKLLDPATNLPRSGSISMEFRLFDASSGGNLIWGPETQSVTVTNGVFSAQLGSVTSLTPADLAQQNLYLSVTAAPDTFPTGEMTPRQPVVASAFSITSAQLVHSGNVRINPGITYSTFTTAGNLQLQYGLSAATAAFTAGVSAAAMSTFSATGNTNYSVVASSGIQLLAGTLAATGNGGIANTYGLQTGSVTATAGMSAASASTFTATGNTVYSVTMSSGLQILGGTLDMNGSGGIANTYGLQTGSVTATAGVSAAGVSTFTASGASNYSIVTSSGVNVQGGIVQVDASGGLNVKYGVVAATFTGGGTYLVGATPQVSNSSASATVTLTANTESIAVSTSIAPTLAGKNVVVFGSVMLLRAALAVGACEVRVRRSTTGPGTCTATSTKIFALPVSVANTASLAVGAPVLAVDNPNTTNNTEYCLGVVCNQAHQYQARSLTLSMGSP